jgi:uncharacterized membrane protein
MGKGRLEAFSDGVLAILITIMVLELPRPPGSDLAALQPLLPVLLSYTLSFVYLGIYWNNHHHLFQATRQVNGQILWANLHLLFWLSLVPFTTRWLGDSQFAAWPTVVYGAVLLLAGAAYFLLSRALIAEHGRQSTLAAAVGADRKGLASLALYGLAIPLALVQPCVACGIYTLVALIWLVPDRRIERLLRRQDQSAPEEGKE